MKEYKKPEVEVIKIDPESFIATSGDTPLGSFTCGQYTQGGSCSSITWSSTGYSCGSYSNGSCQSVYSPTGSMGDGCAAWKLTCSKF